MTKRRRRGWNPFTLARTLAARLRAAGLHVEGVSYFPIVTLDRYEGCYAETTIPFISAYVAGQGTVPEDELRQWAEEQDDLNKHGAHFYASGRFSFLATRAPDTT